MDRTSQPDAGAPEAAREAPRASGESPPPAPAAQRNPLLRLAIEVGPLMVFLLFNARWESFAPGSEWEPIFAATAAFMAATVVSLAASLVLERRVPVMPLVTAFFVLVFGGLTIALEDDLFIKLKPTVVNTLFALVLLGGLATGRSLLKPLLGTALELTDEGWRLLTLRWGFFFLFLAGLNEVAWRSLSTDGWVRFKVWGVIGITLAFTFSQAPLIQRHAVERGSES